jgi:hypothetical protein
MLHVGTDYMLHVLHVNILPTFMILFFVQYGKSRFEFSPLLLICLRTRDIIIHSKVPSSIGSELVDFYSF